MPKIQKISGNVMIKYLNHRGFSITRRKGSHVTLRCGNIATTVPAGSSILKIGYVEDII